MPEISVRGLEMPESPIRKLAPLAAAAKKRGTKFIAASDYASPSKVDDEHLSEEGHEKLAQAILEALKK